MTKGKDRRYQQRLKKRRADTRSCLPLVLLAFHALLCRCGTALPSLDLAVLLLLNCSASQSLPGRPRLPLLFLTPHSP
uniref:Uncharacterized protein n=1 Tax=Oryza sativa subsp. japonica TaxID=39947 RepID=Q6EPK4_ORYSJ|nr:hypothetical protein [Oryza sativa Japonica Group]